VSILKTTVSASEYEPLPPYDERFHYLTRIGVEGRPFRSGFVIAEPEQNVVDEDPVDGAIFVLEGEARVETADGESIVLGPGDFVSFEKGIRQTWEIVSRFKAAVFFLGR
jgi:mannose-6-phosphate isomerase-like protein (cupin superfamily)